MGSGSAICSGRRVGAFIALSPSDGNDDFERIAIGEPGIRVAAARHDLAVFLYGHALSGKLERFQKPHDIRAGLKTLRLTVDGELDHLETPET